MSERTLYDRLQVAPDASAEVIKAAYRSLCQKWHPDRNPGREAEAGRVTTALNVAFEVLSDPSRRAAYDASLSQQATQLRRGPARAPRVESTLRQHGRHPYLGAARDLLFGGSMLSWWLRQPYVAAALGLGALLLALSLHRGTTSSEPPKHGSWRLALSIAAGAAAALALLRWIGSLRSGHTYIIAIVGGFVVIGGTGLALYAHRQRTSKRLPELLLLLLFVCWGPFAWAIYRLWADTPWAPAWAGFAYLCGSPPVFMAWSILRAPSITASWRATFGSLIAMSCLLATFMYLEPVAREGLSMRPPPGLPPLLAGANILGQVLALIGGGVLLGGTLCLLGALTTKLARRIRQAWVPDGYSALIAMSIGWLVIPVATLVAFALVPPT